MDVSQNVEMRLLRSGMDSRFSNVVIRGSPASAKWLFLESLCEFSDWRGEAPVSHFGYSRRRGIPQVLIRNPRYPINKN